jgi:transcriptional regulator with XRE-family HTH domain
LAKGIQDARYRQLIEALAAARRVAGISQVELAKALGKRQQFVSKYESGERRLDAMELFDIAGALGLDVLELLETAAGRGAHNGV